MNEMQHQSQGELLSRLDLIETMVRDGRRTIEYWGWTQVLWGAAYLIAIGWSYGSDSPNIAWPVTMVVAVVITIAVSSRKKRAGPVTTISRAIRAIWIGVGAGLFLFCFPVGISGHFEIHSFMAAIEILLGVANLASALILRWRMQLGVGIIWWAAAVATCFVRDEWVIPILAAATLLGPIAFGIYLMYRERVDRRRREVHG